MGGNEFAFFLPDILKDDDVVMLIDRIFDTLKRPFQIAAQEIIVKGSFGISSYPKDGEDAEMAMYNAKQEEKGRFKFYASQLHKRLHQTLKIETALRHAIELNELKLHYQPLVDLRSGEIMGVEAHLRWPRQDGSQTSPADFIPVAEETGLILPIGEWVLRTACEQNKAWHDKGHVTL